MIFIMFLIGPVAAVGGVGLVPVLVIMGLVGVYYCFAERNLTGVMDREILVLLAMFVALGMVSGFWAPVASRAVSLPPKIALLSILGLLAFRSLNDMEPKDLENAELALIAGVGGGFLIVAGAYAYTLATGQPLWGSESGNPLTYLSTGQASLGLVAWPVAAIIFKRWGVKTAVVFFFAVVALFVFLSFFAVLLGLAVGAAMLVVTVLTKSRALASIGVLIAVLVLFAPVIIWLTPDADILYEKFSFVWPSGVHRFYIWQFVTERISENPFFGWGMDSSRFIPGGHDRIQWHGQNAWMGELLPLHPHNAALQVWLELGFAGALLMAAFVCKLFIRRSRLPGETLKNGFYAAAAGTYLTMGAFSYGIWQNWWVALGWLVPAIIGSVLGKDGTGMKAGPLIPRGTNNDL